MSDVPPPNWQMAKQYKVTFEFDMLERKTMLREAAGSAAFTIVCVGEKVAIANAGLKLAALYKAAKTRINVTSVYAVEVNTVVPVKKKR